MDQLRARLADVKVVQPLDIVHKDECICSFDTPESEDGIYISMKSFEAVGADYLKYHHDRYKHSVYLHHKRRKYKIDKPESIDSKPKRLAIGLEGGFNPDGGNDDVRVEDNYSIVLMPERTEILMPNPDLPILVQQSYDSILDTKSSEHREPNDSRSVWDGEKRQVSKHYKDLYQVSPAPRVPRSDWKCEKCDKTDNLWLNLSDGSILCGRKFFDGSGGNNHAIEHYEKHKYPLAVKLGTITSTGADVFSYAEDDMVTDPLLQEHLAYFGYDTGSSKKTEKTMIELEIEANKKVGEWSIIQEEGKNLMPVSGPGFTGLANLGNSCYMNSILQVLFSIEEYKSRYFPPTEIFQVCDGPSDFNHQMAKLAHGLLSGNYSKIDPQLKQQKGISPRQFKHYVCKDDMNFSSKRQQDAHEFFMFIIGLSDLHSKNFGLIDDRLPELLSPIRCLESVIEDKIVCTQSKRVKYTQRLETCLSLHIDLDLATNRDEYERYKQMKERDPNARLDVVRPKVPLFKCIKQFGKTELVKDYYSTAVKTKVDADKTSKIAQFPRVLMFQMKKFYHDANYAPKKLDIELDVPDVLDLELLTAKGLQPNEVELDSSSSNDTPEAPGSSEPGPSSSETHIEPNQEAMETMLSMGIDMTQAIEALKMCNNNAQRAIELIFDPDSFLAAASEPSSPQQHSSLSKRGNAGSREIFSKPDLRPKLYQLKAFISHMGASATCGHYVCHIKIDEQWYIFNDEKVSRSENPPKEFGYLYFYERITVD